VSGLGLGVQVARRHPRPQGRSHDHSAGAPPTAAGGVGGPAAVARTASVLRSLAESNIRGRSTESPNRRLVRRSAAQRRKVEGRSVASEWTWVRGRKYHWRAASLAEAARLDVSTVVVGTSRLRLGAATSRQWPLHRLPADVSRPRRLCPVRRWDSPSDARGRRRRPGDLVGSAPVKVAAAAANTQ